MKLFSISDWNEGETVARESYISIGKYHSSSSTATESWYLRFELPIATTKKYVDPATFEPTVGPGRRVILAVWRKSKKNLYMNRWSPLPKS